MARSATVLRCSQSPPHHVAGHDATHTSVGFRQSRDPPQPHAHEINDPLRDFRPGQTFGHAENRRKDLMSSKMEVLSSSLTVLQRDLHSLICFTLLAKSSFCQLLFWPILLAPLLAKKFGQNEKQDKPKKQSQETTKMTKIGVGQKI